MQRLSTRVLPAGAMTLMLAATAARAELAEISITQQHGIGYLPLMEEQKLIEKHAKAVSRNPAVKTVSDLTDKDRIGLPAVPDSWKDMFFPDMHALPGS